MRSDDWIPHREQDLVDMIARWKKSLANTANQAAFGWDADECSALLIKLGNFVGYREEYELDPTPQKRLEKDNAKKIAVMAMRSFANSSVRFNQKMPESDKLDLGVHTVSTKRTPKPDPTDLVEFELGTIPAAHCVTVAYHIKGSTKRGKGPYHAGEIRYWIRAVDEAAPQDANEEGWHSVADTASPWKKIFPGADAAKRLFVTMRWENSATSGEENRGKGLWNEIASIIIP